MFGYRKAHTVSDELHYRTLRGKLIYSTGLGVFFIGLSIYIVIKLIQVGVSTELREGAMRYGGGVSTGAGFILVFVSIALIFTIWNWIVCFREWRSVRRREMTHLN